MMLFLPFSYLFVLELLNIVYEKIYKFLFCREMVTILGLVLALARLFHHPPEDSLVLYSQEIRGC